MGIDQEQNSASQKVSLYVVTYTYGFQAGWIQASKYSQIGNLL